MENPQPTSEPQKSKRSVFGLVSGLVLLVLGILMLLENYFPQAGKLFGPAILIIVGLSLILPAMRK